MPVNVLLSLHLAASNKITIHGNYRTLQECMFGRQQNMAKQNAQHQRKIQQGERQGQESSGGRRDLIGPTIRRQGGLSQRMTSPEPEENPLS